MLFSNKKTPDKHYKFKDLLVYSSTEWLADGKKKYRRVFENLETTYLYAELSFYNKLFDESEWSAKITLKCYRFAIEDTGVNTKKEEIGNISIDKKISIDENIVFVREGWGNVTPGAFWARGDYEWEAFIDGESVGKTRFYVEDGGMVSPDHNPYFDIETIKLYEGPNSGVAQPERTYYTHFAGKETRYVWAEITLNNSQLKLWNCELTFNFYNDAGQLKGKTNELRQVNHDETTFYITSGWGSDTIGTWYTDKYTLELIFMDQLIAVVPFEVGSEFVEGVGQLLIGSEVNGGMLPLEQDDDKETFEEVIKSLDELIGLEELKARVHEYVHYLKFLKLRQEKGFDESMRINLHTVFKGNPGTGKTTVAKLLGKIYNKMGLLSRGKVLEVGRAELVGQYIGQTAPKVKEAIEKARGGVLFIDEAYSLVRGQEDNKDYGKEVIEVLIKEMSDGKGDIAIIIAGYPKEMDTLLEANPGFKSRFNMYFDFPDYVPSELESIAKLQETKKNIKFTPEAFNLLMKKLIESYRNRDDSYGNARLVNSLVDEAKMNMGLRVMKNYALDQITQEMLQTIDLEDVKKINKGKSKKAVHIGTDVALLEEAMLELNEMIGLREVKNQIHELIKLVQFYRETGKDVLGRFSLHSVFAGNPGTGKTTVARIIAKIYKALGILEKGHIIEVDRAGLVAGFVGQTAIKTKEKLDEAKGGVLFIDEAYSLMSETENDFGKEAIEVILKTMEDKRGQFIVVVAGYTDNMNRFLEMNPGLKSRFDKTFLFEDYTANDLYDIALMMLRKENLEPDKAAQEHLHNHLQAMYERRDKYFGNARSVRKIIAVAVRNQHLRMASMLATERTEEILNTLTLSDIKELDRNNLDEKGGQAIGFRF